MFEPNRTLMSTMGNIIWLVQENMTECLHSTRLSLCGHVMWLLGTNYHSALLSPAIGQKC